MIYIGGYVYEGKLSVRDSVRIRLPAEIGSLILNGSKRREFWANVKVKDDVVEIYECRDPQRRLLEYLLNISPFTSIVGSRSPRYGRGQRYCSRCRISFYIEVSRCPYCGASLRRSGRGEKYNEKDRKYVDPRKYGVDV